MDHRKKKVCKNLTVKSLPFWSYTYLTSAASLFDSSFIKALKCYASRMQPPLVQHLLSSHTVIKNMCLYGCICVFPPCVAPSSPAVPHQAPQWAHQSPPSQLTCGKKEINSQFHFAASVWQVLDRSGLGACKEQERESELVWPSFSFSQGPGASLGWSTWWKRQERQRVHIKQHVVCVEEEMLMDHMVVNSKNISLFVFAK